MAKHWLCEVVSGKLVACDDFEESRDGEVQSSKGAPNEQRWMEVPEGEEWTCVKVDADLTDPDAPVYSLVADATKSNQEWDKLRARRDAELAKCDWTQAADSPLAAQDKTDWASYRQYLRDLPSNEASADMEHDDFATWLAAQP